MRSPLPRRRVQRRAFTLIELIVVIVILGILAALAVPAFSAVIDRSRDESAAQTWGAVIREAQALAAFDNRAVTAADIAVALGDMAAADGITDEPGAPYTYVDTDVDDDGTADATVGPNQWSVDDPAAPTVLLAADVDLDDRGRLVVASVPAPGTNPAVDVRDYDDAGGDADNADTQRHYDDVPTAEAETEASSGTGETPGTYAMGSPGDGAGVLADLYRSQGVLTDASFSQVTDLTPADHFPHYAADGNTATYQHTETTVGSWWQVDLGEGRSLRTTDYVIRARDSAGATTDGPRDFQLLGSNDGSTWSVVDDVTDAPLDVATYQGFSADDQTNAYRYLRIQLTGEKHNGMWYLIMAEVEFYGELTEAAVDYSLSADFTDGTLDGWTLQGSASNTGTRVALTADAAGQSGWIDQPAAYPGLPDAFTLDFDFDVVNGAGDSADAVIASFFADQPAGISPTTGYGVVFDHYNDNISLWENGGAQLAQVSVPEFTTLTGTTTFSAQVQVSDTGTVTVLLDGVQQLQHTIGSIDRTERALRLSAWTGAASSAQLLHGITVTPTP